jgi:pimeloyl-ACP methyl ester carboxylesterase
MRPTLHPPASNCPIPSPHPTRQDVNERTGLDIAGACAQIAAAGRVHVLTVHGMGDPVIPSRDAELFHRALPGSELVLIEGADHNFTGREHRQRLVEVAVESLSRP